MHKTTDNELLQDAKKNVSSVTAVAPACRCVRSRCKGCRNLERAGQKRYCTGLAEGGIEPTPDVLAAVNFCLCAGLRRDLPE